MNGHVYQTHGETDDKRQWLRTTEELGLYINKHYKFAGDLSTVYKDIERPSITKPTKPTTVAGEGLDDVEQEIWKEEIKEYVLRKRTLEENLRKIYAVVWGQCSMAMKAKVMTTAEFLTKDNECDCVWLLKTVRSITFQFEGHKNFFLANMEARTSIERCHQNPQETTADFFERFTSIVSAFEHYGGTIGNDEGIIADLKKQHVHDDPGPAPEILLDDEAKDIKALIWNLRKRQNHEKRVTEFEKKSAPRLDRGIWPFFF